VKTQRPVSEWSGAAQTFLRSSEKKQKEREEERMPSCFTFSLFFQTLATQIGFSHSYISESKLQFGESWSKKFCNWQNKISFPEKTGTTSPNVIIGMATGSSYTFDKLVPFCKSARSSGFHGSVILGVTKLAGRNEKKRKKMFEKFNITGVYLTGLKGNEWGQSTCRYHAYLKIIRHFASEGDSILISDVRDVFFQADPFTSFPAGAVNFLNTTTSLLLFSEGLNDITEQQAILRNTRANFRWILNIYGHTKAKLIAGNAVLCSGTTIGTRSGMLYYTRAMLYEAYLCIARNPKKVDGKRGHVCAGGADQGFHNYLFWNNMLNASVVLLNAEGPVYTIGVFRGKPVRSLNFERNIEGDVISPSQRGVQYVVPVIHQWDRHADLLKHVFDKFDLVSEGVSKQTFSSHLLEGSFSSKVTKTSRGL